jgi:hypothetical protein
MTRANTLLTMPSIRADRASSRPLLSLIEVPEVKGSRTRRVDPGAQTRADEVWQGRRPSRSPRKRRLRREIRIAGCAFLVLAPLLSACTLGWSNGPVRVLACSITDATAGTRGPVDNGAATDASGPPEAQASDSPGVVVLSIEPAVTGPAADTKVPVVFSGFVLPDDSLEDASHEGS